MQMRYQLRHSPEPLPLSNSRNTSQPGSAKPIGVGLGTVQPVTARLYADNFSPGTTG